MTIALTSIARPDAGASILAVSGTGLVLRTGSLVGAVAFDVDTPVALPALVPGTDYAVRLVDGLPVAEPCGDGVPSDAIGGFHFAPGGNATARAGGDAVPAINPCSCWDAGFRPSCPDPRGMALVTGLAEPFWCDIYLLGVDHRAMGTSRHGVEIADGRSLPVAPEGGGKAKKLDYATAVAIYAAHGKQLLTYDEFRAAAFGVTERSGPDDDSETTGLDAPRTSRFGLMQATGNLWAWGTDGDPDEPRPSFLGGSWLYGVLAGSRQADLGYWPVDSVGYISARGRCGHLTA